MRRIAMLLSLVATVNAAGAGETLFTSGPQEYAGTKYYWLAHWELQVSVPLDVSPEDRLEVLFGSKGPQQRTLYFHDGQQQGMLSEVRSIPYAWVSLPTGPLRGGQTVRLFGKGSGPVAFLAGVRIVGQSTAALDVKPLPVVLSSPSGQGDGAAVWSELSGFELSEPMRKLWDPAPTSPDWQRAERSSHFAGIALSKVQRWLHERCLRDRDPTSGLFRPTGSEWNYWDTAADCYPFYVWAAYFTDKEVLDTVMVEALLAEQRLCNRLDRLPTSYDMDRQQQIDVPLDRMIFGASEYAKDGLIPVVEITGRESPWFHRMRGIVDDIFKHASVDTPYGKIPSTDIEVNGELLQLLPRLFSMTGDEQYLQWAHRLADHYLLPGKFVPERLSDHGCEIIGGLGLLLAVDSTAHPEKCRQYQPHLQYMFDEILRRGTNSDGVIVGTLQETAGPHDEVILRDGWGYDLVGFLDYDLALGEQRYAQAVRRPMTNLLKPRYQHFNWDHPSRDNVADSVEGALYLLHRVPVSEAFVWADREMATLLVDHVQADRLWETHKLEANTVRTVLIHAMLHTRNVVARPWQAGLRLGAAPCGQGICLYLSCDKPYQGCLQFDIPRHRLYMGLREDWPRMNAVPEWFTVEPDESHMYSVKDVDARATQLVTGKLLSEGLAVNVRPAAPLRLVVEPP